MVVILERERTNPYKSWYTSLGKNVTIIFVGLLQIGLVI